MKPSITFHGVARIELSPIRSFPEEFGAAAFASRSLTLVDAAGNRLTVGLFAPFASALHVDGDAPRGEAKCGDEPPLTEKDRAEHAEVNGRA